MYNADVVGQNTEQYQAKCRVSGDNYALDTGAQNQIVNTHKQLS